MKKSLVAVNFILILLLSMPQAMLAQVTPEPAQADWNNLKTVPPGDEFVVNLKNGETIKGRMKSVDDKTLTLTRGRKGTSDIAQGDVRKVYRLTPKSTKKATLIGLAIGAGIGAGIGGKYVSDSGESGEYYPIVLLGGVGAGLGALTGFFAGRGKKQVLIYETR
jgi:hypothetical protein